VTCGADECQQARHAKQCREWRAANSEATASHYEDVVVPFRERQPDYQRRCRWRQRLREIREKTTRFGGSLLLALRGLVQRAERLAAQAADVVQTGVLAGEKLGRAVAVVRSTIAAIEQLETSMAELRELGL